jgi:hypothetical protein
MTHPHGGIAFGGRIEIATVPPGAQVSFSMHHVATNTSFAMTADSFDPVVRRWWRIRTAFVTTGGMLPVTEQRFIAETSPNGIDAWAGGPVSVPIPPHSTPDGNAAVYALETTAAEPVEIASAFACPDGTQ